MEQGIRSHIDSVISVLPSRLSDEIREACAFRSVEELRLRIGRPPQIVYSNGESVLNSSVLTKNEMNETLERLCGHSVYSFEDELKQGYVTFNEGIRVGVCGRVRIDNGRIIGITDIHGFNIRVAYEALGCAEGIMSFVTEHGLPVSSLIVSPPGGGKTTLLRDIARCLSDGIGCAPVKVCLADERGELSGCAGGIPAYDVGKRTDIMEFAPKSEAMAMLVRTMNPDVIITDEIGSEGDAHAVSEAARCGVSVIASAHASSADELRMRRGIREILDSNVFRRILLLKRNGSKLHIYPVKP